MLCAGRAYCDLVFSGLDRLPTLGTETFARALGVHAGGGACITAAWLASLGRPAALCATLPAAPFDAAFIAEARACGVNLDACAASTGGEPQITAAMVHGGDRGFLTRKVGPALPSDHERHLVRPDIGHLHVSELGTLLECPELARAAKRAGLSVSLDCAWDDAALARDDLASLLVDVDVFLPNESEAAALAAGGNALSDVALTVIKRGAAGAVAHVGRDATGERHASVERRGEAVDAVDPTGAGDAFDAGFLHAWLDGAHAQRDRGSPHGRRTPVRARRAARTAGGGRARARGRSAHDRDDRARLVGSRGELSVAATKSCVNSIVAGLWLSAFASDDAALQRALQELPARLDAALARGMPALEELLDGETRLVVLGRGPAFGLAGEIALKAIETCAVHASAYSSAEVLHGPSAMLVDDFPVLLLNAAHGRGNDAALERLPAQGARVVAADPRAWRTLPVPPDGHPLVRALDELVGAYAVLEAEARRRGRDPDRPPNLVKATDTV